MRWPLLLCLVIIVSTLVTAVEVDINTYMDSDLTTASSVFKDGDTVYFTASNGVSCCESKIANLIYQGFPAINVETNDKGTGVDKIPDDGIFSGKFTLGTQENNADDGYVHVEENDNILIYVALTTLSTGSFEVGTDYMAPSPINLNSELIGNTISLSWAASNDNSQVIHYNIYRSTSPINEGNKQLLNTTTDLNYIDTTILDGRTYYYAVSAQDQSGNIATLSNIEQLTTPDITPPTKVQSVTIFPKPNGEIRIDWDNANDNVGVNRYVIYKDTLSNPNVEHIKVQLNTFSEINEQHGMEFYYAIAAEDAAGNIGPKSNIHSIIVDKLAPDQIFDLSAKTLSDGNVKLNWSSRIDAEEYKLYVSDYEDLSDAIEINTGNKSNHQLTLSKEKYIAVTSLDKIGNEADFSNIVYVIPDSEAPEIPKNLTIKATNDLRILLNWNQVNSSDLSHYQIYRKSDLEFEYLDTVENNTYVDQNLEHNKLYSYYVIAVDLVNNIGSPTEEVSAQAQDLEIQLDITNPLNDSSVDTSLLIVSGLTKKGTKINITNWNFASRAIVDNSGHFLGYINMREGKNRIKVTAQDANNNSIIKTLIVYSNLKNNSKNIIIQEKNYSIDEFLTLIEKKNNEIKNEINNLNSDSGLNKDQKKLISDLTKNYMDKNLETPIRRAADDITLEALSNLGLDSTNFEKVRSEVVNSLSDYFQLNNKELKANLAQIDNSLVEQEKKFNWSILLWISAGIILILAIIKYKNNHLGIIENKQRVNVKLQENLDEKTNDQKQEDNNNAEEEKFDINAHLDKHMKK